MLWIIIGLLIGTFLLYTLWKVAKGIPYTLESIEDAINALLKRGYNGGFLVINIAKSEYFIQLRKYIRGPGDYGILLAFPHAEWSQGLFPQLKEFCESHGITYFIEVEKALKPLEFLHVDFEKDSAKAHNVVKGIILEVFGFDKDVKLFGKLEHGSVKDELVDRDIQG